MNAIVCHTLCSHLSFAYDFLKRTILMPSYIGRGWCHLSCDMLWSQLIACLCVFWFFNFFVQHIICDYVPSRLFRRESAFVRSSASSFCCRRGRCRRRRGRHSRCHRRLTKPICYTHVVDCGVHADHYCSVPSCIWYDVWRLVSTNTISTRIVCLCLCAVRCVRRVKKGSQIL